MLRSVALLVILITTLLYTPITTSEIEGLQISSSSISISIDGDPAEWGTFECPGFPVGNDYGIWYYRTVNNIPQWIWCDAIGDERTDFASPDPRADLVQFRITGDMDYVYFLFIFRDTSGFYIGDDGGTFVALTINRNGTEEGEIWFAGQSDTKVNESAKWQYQLVVNLADSRYRDQGYRSVTNELEKNWGGIFLLLNPSWQFLEGDNALMGANVDKNAIEVRIPWSLIGGAPSGSSFFLRLSLITGRGWSDYNGNLGGTWDIKYEEQDLSDALDAMTTTGPNTWNDVEDGVVYYYVDVYFTTSPPYYPIPEPGLLIAVVSVAVAGFGVFIGLRGKKVVESQGS
ncbi:MAG: hypothetical protein QXE81_02295 [Desulfurococcaceae archaeon]